MAKRKTPPRPAPPTSLANFGTRLSAALDRAQKDPDSIPELHEREGNPRPLAPRVPEAADWVEQQIKGAKANAAKWKARTLRPKKDPIAAAKAARGKWENKMRAAIDEGNFAKGLDAVDEAAMLETIEQTPETAFSGGIERRARKIRTKVEKLRPMVGALAGEIDAMPQDTDEQREQRAIAAIRGMREIGKRMKGA